jgi:uracil-DNA glycosylase
MDIAAPDELLGELLDLTRRLRGQLSRHAALGTWAAPGGASARPDGPTEAEADGEAQPPGGSAPEALEEAPAAVPDRPAELTAARDPAAERFAAQGAAAVPRAVPEARAAAQAHAVELVAAADTAAGVGDAPVALGRRMLPEIRAELGDCTRCKLHSTRRSIVFGVGAADTPLMFVGEAPGEQEDRRGEPFVGPAGQLLDKMIEAMGWTRAAVYIANTTKCRPPGNRNPQPDELAQCMPFLHAQIAAIAPRIIVALGRPASNQLLGTDAPISALRGRFHDYALPSDGVRLKIMPTFHPAYLLRDPSKKRTAWEDLKLVMAELTRLGIAPPAAPRG